METIKRGISQITGKTEIKLGEKALYKVSRIYRMEDHDKVKNALWKIYMKENGSWRELKPSPTAPPKKGDEVSYTITNQKLVGKELLIEAYIYEPEMKIPPGLKIKVVAGDEKKIHRVKLFMADDTPITENTILKYNQSIKVKVYTQNMPKEFLKLTLYEDDATGAGHNLENEKNKVAEITKLTNTNGFLWHEFKLNADFSKIANAMIDGSSDKLHEYYVLVESAKYGKKASKNAEIDNPDYIVHQTYENGKVTDHKKIYGETLIQEVVIKGKYKKQMGINPIANTGRSVSVVGAPPEKEEEKEKNCSCLCEREITPNELKKMIIAMRKSTNDNMGENFYKWNKDSLFTSGHEKFTDKSYEKFAEALNKTFNKYEINSCIRKIHFLAQCYHETGAFTRSVEGSFKDSFWYDPYRGRGFIHLTLKGNYQKFKDISGIDVVNSPKLVSTNIDIAADSSGWYWKYNDKGDINPFADKDSVFDTSRLVNKPNATKPSSINGYSQRLNAINALKLVFEYPKNCCNNKKKEDVNKNITCSSNLEDCICLDSFKVEDGFIKHTRIIKNHINIIEHGDFKDSKSSIQKIILHRTAGGTTKACIDSFKSGRKSRNGGIDHYGTHFIVGKDGTITQTASLNKVTWHCSGWNSKSIGIEVVGFALDKNGKPTLGLKGQNSVTDWEDLTETQAKSVACLIKSLLIYYNLDKSKIDCHEHLAPKEKGEGQIVYNAIKEYL